MDEVSVESYSHRVMYVLNFIHTKLTFKHSPVIVLIIFSDLVRVCVTYVANLTH